MQENKNFGNNPVLKNMHDLYLLTEKILQVLENKNSILEDGIQNCKIYNAFIHNNEIKSTEDHYIDNIGRLLKK